MTAVSAPPKGAIILAGSHGAIALARLFARQGLDVWFLTNYTPLPRFSRAVSNWRIWPGAESKDALSYLEALIAEQGLEGYLVVPAADADVKFVSENSARLSQKLIVPLPDWEALKWAADKSLCYARAAELGIDVPQTYPIHSLADAETAELDYPVVLKPAERVALNRFIRDKVWRADDRAAFLRLYKEAHDLVGAEGIVVQEMIPGGGECQFSYAGLWWQGKPVVGFTARRLRQYPIEFSYTSTFVETIEAEDVRAAAEKFLAAIGHHGLCEIEFKRDPRTGALKLLDINPRPWSWFGLADAAGVDFGAAMVLLAAGQKVPEMQAQPGVGWMFTVRDIVVALQLALKGRLDIGAWLRSVLSTRSFASFALSDPLPGIIELPLTIVRIIGRNLPGRS